MKPMNNISPCVMGWLVATLLLMVSSCLLAAPKSAHELSMQGKRYELARGVKRDYARALRNYCMAARMGHVEANFFIGKLYFDGRGVKRNTAQAMAWFKRGAKGGDRLSKVMLEQHPTMKAKKSVSCIRSFSTKRRKYPATGRRIYNSANRKKVEKWVSKIAPKYSIDPALVMAVIGAESGFKSNALSPKSAQGLMQLIPSTAARFGVNDPWDPQQNINGGVAYLRWLMRHFKGDVELVLAAYNAGEGAVERYKGVPPYSETQHYVRRILGEYQKTTHPIPPAKKL